MRWQPAPIATSPPGDAGALLSPDQARAEVPDAPPGVINADLVPVIPKKAPWGERRPPLPHLDLALAPMGGGAFLWRERNIRPPVPAAARDEADVGLHGHPGHRLRTVGEMCAGADPASIRSISTSGDNQDINPMGTIATRESTGLVEEATRVIAIETLAAIRGFDLAGGFAAGGAGFSARTSRFAERVYALSGFIDTDHSLAPDIARVAAAAWEGELAL